MTVKLTVPVTLEFDLKEDHMNEFVYDLITDIYYDTQPEQFDFPDFSRVDIDYN